MQNLGCPSDICSKLPCWVLRRPSAKLTDVSSTEMEVKLRAQDQRSNDIGGWVFFSQEKDKPILSNKDIWKIQDTKVFASGGKEEKFSQFATRILKGRLGKGLLHYWTAESNIHSKIGEDLKGYEDIMCSESEKSHCGSMSQNPHWKAIEQLPPCHLVMGSQYSYTPILHSLLLRPYGLTAKP